MDMTGSFYRDVLNNLHDGVYFVDTDRRITLWNRGAERITGYSAEEVIDSHCHHNLLNHVDAKGTKLCLEGCPLASSMADGVERATEVYLHHKEGYRVPVFVRTMPIYEGDTIVGCVEIFRDNTERLLTIEKLAQLEEAVMTDPMTEAASRLYVETFIASKLIELNTLGISFGVAFIDVDDFKSVNDTYGHDTGDAVLQTLVATGLNTLRKTDLIGRWGGEEFVVVFVGVDEREVAIVSEKLRILIENSRTRTAEDEWVSVTVSIGATLAKKGDTVERIIRRADEKMYISKKNGKNQVTV